MIDGLKLAIEPLIIENIQHDFNQAMLTESLPLSQYTYYCVQDQFYLDEYSRALAMIAARCRVREHTQLLLRFAHEAINQEHALHARHISQHPVLAQPWIKQGANTVCQQYSDYLLAGSKSKSIAEAIAGVLPCFYIYWRVGVHMACSPHYHRRHRYRDWIDVYASEAFAEATESMFSVLQATITSAHQLAQVREILIRSTIFEQQFWQACVEML